MAATTLSGPLLSKEFEHGGNMQYTLIVILLVLWLMGEATDHTFGGLLHILFLAALVVYGTVWPLKGGLSSTNPIRKRVFLTLIL